MNKDFDKCCRLCEYAETTVGDEMICLRHGPVSGEHCCRKFRYDPFKRIPPRKAALNLDADIKPL